MMQRIVTEPGRSATVRARLARLVPFASGRLFRKYATLLLALIGSILLVNAAIEAFYTNRETREALIAVQQEKARGAAAVIEQFVKEIEGQIGWTTHASVVTGAAGADQRRLDFLRLLRQAPAITELTHIDADGREQLKVSRLAMDVAASGADLSQDPRFVEARARRRYMSAVYYRKESEPYMTLAVAGQGRSSGVTIAEVNLKFIWDVISRIKVGKAGAAYVIDRNGLLIAHPDIGLVLRKTDLAPRNYVTAAREHLAAPFERPIPYDGIDWTGRKVLTAFAPIEPLGWLVFVDLPASEAFEPLRKALLRSALIALGALSLATLAGLWLTRRMVVPIQALAAGAERIGTGDLDHRIDVQTGDEVEALADTFNAMGAQLKAHYAGLEQAVKDRTAELSEALEYQTATSGVLAVISKSPNEVQPVLDALVASASELCDAPMVSLFVRQGDELPGRARHGFSKEMMEELAPLPQIYGRGSLAGRVIDTHGTVHIPDAAADAEYTSHDYVRITGSRSMLGVPLMRAGQPLGLLALYRTVPQPFTPRQIELMQTFSDQAVIAMENARLFEAEQTRTKELTESLEYQTATSEVLSVISRSPNDLQPVLDAVVSAGCRLLGGQSSILRLLKGDALHFGAMFNASGPGDADCRIRQPLTALTMGMWTEVVEGRAPAFIADTETDARITPQNREIARARGYRSFLSVPLLRRNAVIGTLNVSRRDSGPFAAREIALLQTFADQAVIAINNVGLFEAEQARTKELTESLEYQTATSEVLGVISRSPDELQPVLDAIVGTAQRLCGSDRAYFYLLEAQSYRMVCSSGAPQHVIEDLRSKPRRVGDRGSLVGRLAIERRTLHITDVAQDPEFDLYHPMQPGRTRTNLGVPLLRSGEMIGAIIIVNVEVRPFTQRQIDLVTTFANQAVIAINNVGLFEQVQARTKELQESLQHQTASSEVLEIISTSPGALEPVYMAMLTSALKHCEAQFGGLFRYEDGAFQAMAGIGVPKGMMIEAVASDLTNDDSDLACLLAQKRPMHIADLRESPSYRARDPFIVGAVEKGGARAGLLVPLVRDGELTGAFAIYRKTPQAFTDKQVSLVTGFARQAVIAIENTRLLQEIQQRSAELARTVNDLKALSEVGQVVSSTLDQKAVLSMVVERAALLAQADAGVVFRIGERDHQLDLVETYGFSAEMGEAYRLAGIQTAVSGVREAIAKRLPVHVPDIAERPPSPLRDLSISRGYHASLIVPLIAADRALGTLTILRKRKGEFAPGVVSMIQSFANQSAIALHNAQLFDQIAEKSRQIEIASQHKSQFLANMSHELRTPLNAILGYAELLVDGTYGPLPDKPKGVLERVERNGRHLLGLINDVLDLSKIEAGEMTLAIEEYSWGSLVRNVVAATEPLAGAKGLKLETDVAEGLPRGAGDARRLNQVLLNLVGNAIKFTDSGSVRITARASDGKFQISVIDTGPGIAEDDCVKIFEKFQQIDNSSTRKKGGSGLGLSISRELVELHGGTISVTSILGQGATFEIVLPCRVEQPLEANP